MVEALVPTIFDSGYVWGMVDETKPDPSMPKGTTIPKWGGTLWAHLVDIKRAWNGAELEDGDRRALLLVGGMGLTHQLAGHFEGVGRSTITRRYERGVGVLTCWLNGMDYSEGELPEDDG